jgi:hypothetical protein
MKKVLLVLLFGFSLVLMPKATFAQSANTPSITLDLKDAPIRTTLEMAFKQAGINNFVIDNNVAGFVTMTITDQPFENALKLIMRASTEPLTYTKENNVYIVKVRVVTPTPQTGGPDPIQPVTINSLTWERIPLVYIDPFDLQVVLGPILNISQFTRSGGGMGNGGFGGGFGSAGGLGGGSMGGFGGAGMGNGNGMGGGAMGGFGGGGGAFGGMNGGVGGFGGGRNF